MTLEEYLELVLPRGLAGRTKRSLKNPPDTAAALSPAARRGQIYNSLKPAEQSAGELR